MMSICYVIIALVFISNLVLFILAFFPMDDYLKIKRFIGRGIKKYMLERLLEKLQNIVYCKKCGKRLKKAEAQKVEKRWLEWVEDEWVEGDRFPYINVVGESLVINSKKMYFCDKHRQKENIIGEKRDFGVAIGWNSWLGWSSIKHRGGKAYYPQLQEELEKYRRWQSL